MAASTGSCSNAFSAANIALSKSEINYIRDGCRDNCRSDGRSRNEFRTYSIITGSEHSNNNNNNNNNSQQQQQAPPLILSNGSARIVSASNDNLHMLCSVKAEIVTPAAAKPCEGIVELHVETMPSLVAGNSSSSTGTNKRRMEEEMEALLLHLVVNYVVDRNALCIVPGQYCWRINIDLYLLTGRTSGSLLDSASHVIRAAIQNTLLPSVSVINKNEREIDDSNTSKKQPSNTVELLVDGDIIAAAPPAGADNAPIIVTVTIMKCYDVTTGTPQYVFVMDASAEEEASSYSQIHVSITGTTTTITTKNSKQQLTSSSSVCAITKTGYGSLSPQLLPACIAAAVEASQILAHNNHYCYTKPNDPINSMLLQEQFLIQ